MTDINANVEALTLTTYTATITGRERITFPVLNGFSAQWIIQPLDYISVYEIGTTTAKDVYAPVDSQHSNPVRVDRFGNDPDIFIQAGDDVTLVLSNRYRVEKYTVHRYDGSWYLTVNYVFPGAVALTITTNPATITGTPISFLLLEDGTSFYLLEDGTSKLILG